MQKKETKNDVLIINAHGRRKTINNGRYGSIEGNFIFPIVNLKNISGGYPSPKYYLVIKELIIEWATNQQSNANNQAEVCGYIHCDGICDVIAENRWIDLIEHTEIDKNQKETQNTKDLFRFTKLPGRKTSHFKQATNEANLCLLDIEKFKQNDVELEIKSLFDSKKLLPIKHAYITVEIHRLPF